MPAAYDTYDYPSYWNMRGYEHKSELIALKYLLQKIPKVNSILDIGAGYGRLTPAYLYRAKKVILSDPSAKLLKIAKENFVKQKNIFFVQSCAKNLAKKFRAKTFNLILLIRVLHHIQNSDEMFTLVNKLLDNNGYFILELANKKHLKASFKEFFRGNFTFPLDIFPKDIRSKKSIKNKTLPFINYHPEVIKNKLQDNGFEILYVLSVSNIRSEFLKKYVSTSTLLFFEQLLQKPFAYLNLGPSIFILARKRD